jgi:hypothetical protein
MFSVIKELQKQTKENINALKIFEEAFKDNITCPRT